MCSNRGCLSILCLVGLACLAIAMALPNTVQAEEELCTSFPDNMTVITESCQVVGQFPPVVGQYCTPFPPVATCPIPRGIESFVLDDKIDAQSFQSAFILGGGRTPNQALLDLLNDPTKQFVTHFEFSTCDNILQAWTVPFLATDTAEEVHSFFVEHKGDTEFFNGVAIAHAEVAIDRVYTTCVPRPAILIVGPVTKATPVYGPIEGLPHGLSFSFDPSNESGIDNAANVAVVDAGTLTIVGLVAGATVVPKEKPGKGVPKCGQGPNH